MKTYSEEMGEESLDWHEFLNKDEFTFDELKDACSRAEDWVTCAVGNQCSCIPRDEYGHPMDSQLFNLGMEFHAGIWRMRESHEDYGAVNVAFAEMAKEVLNKIEKRSAELIGEYNKK